MSAAATSHPPTPARRSRRGEWWITLPSLAWLGLLFLAPTVIILVMSFRTADHTGGIGSGWTVAHWSTWLQAPVPAILWRTVWISTLTTLGCLLLAVPMAWFMARCTAAWRSWLLLLVIIPFWTNFLIRVFAWKVLLARDGALGALLASLHLMRPGETLLYTPQSVLLVMIYTHLPFAILPLYAAAEKFDFSLLDAARDLGASARRAFVSVFLPGIRAGLLAAALLVFIPALGAYLVSDVVGGHDTEMIGNRIARRAFADRNLPQASALASGLALLVLVPAIWMWLREKRR